MLLHVGGQLGGSALLLLRVVMLLLRLHLLLLELLLKPLHMLLLQGHLLLRLKLPLHPGSGGCRLHIPLLHGGVTVRRTLMHVRLRPVVVLPRVNGMLLRRAAAAAAAAPQQCHAVQRPGQQRRRHDAYHQPASAGLGGGAAL